MKETIRDHLLADATLMGYLTGGLYNSWQHGELNPADTRQANAFELKKLKPTGFLKIENDAPTLQLTREDGKVYRFVFSLMFYIHKAADSTPIYNAKDRAFTLLENWKPLTAWNTEHAEDTLDVEDEALQATMLISRYVMLRRRV